MTLTLSAQTETLLQEHSGRLGEDADFLADALLQQALEEAAQDYEETCQAIADGFADIDAGRTVSFEEVRARWEAEKAARRSKASVTICTPHLLAGMEAARAKSRPPMLFA